MSFKHIKKYVSINILLDNYCGSSFESYPMEPSRQKELKKVFCGRLNKFIIIIIGFTTNKLVGSANLAHFTLFRA